MSNGWTAAEHSLLVRLAAQKMSAGRIAEMMAWKGYCRSRCAVIGYAWRNQIGLSDSRSVWSRKDIKRAA